jgi:hypothetical protein
MIHPRGSIGEATSAQRIDLRRGKRDTGKNLEPRGRETARSPFPFSTSQLYFAALRYFAATTLISTSILGSTSLASTQARTGASLPPIQAFQASFI